MKKHLLLTLLLLPTLSASAESVIYEGLNYNALTDSTAEVAWYGQDAPADVVIPDSITFGSKRLKVTSIGVNAFTGLNCLKLTSVTLPEGIVSIGYAAFRGTANLARVNFPESLDIISGETFYGSGLTQVTLKRTPGTMGDRIFAACQSLERVELPDDMRELPYSIFSGCKSLKSISLPTALETVRDAAFNGCESLERIVLPAGLKNLGDMAFSDCHRLKEIVWNDALEKVGGFLFGGCDTLHELRLPAVFKDVPAYCFQNATGLRTVVLPAGVSSIGEYAFSGCTALEEVQMEAPAFEHLWQEAFGYCTSLHHFDIPASVKFIESTAFYGSGLQELVIGPGIQEVKGHAFYGCNQLDDIYLRTDALDNLWNGVDLFGDPTYYFATLHVKEGKRNFYHRANCWKRFRTIVEESSSGKQYCMVDVTVGGAYPVIVNDTTGSELHLDMEKGSRLVIDLSNDPWASWNTKSYLSTLTVNGQDCKADVVNGQLVIDSIDEDLDIRIDFDRYKCSVFISQDERGGLEVLKGNSDLEAIVMPENGYQAEAVHTVQDPINPRDPQTYEVIGKKTISIWESNDQELNVTYKEK